MINEISIGQRNYQDQYKYIGMSVFSELECALGHPLPDQGDRRPEPGGGGDGSPLQDGGA